MSVLICDADGELWYTRQEELNLDYISMPYSYGGEEYYYDLAHNPEKYATEPVETVAEETAAEETTLPAA